MATGPFYNWDASTSVEAFVIALPPWPGNGLSNGNSKAWGN